jgi:flagellar protein FliS
MYTPASARAASAYRTLSIQGRTDGGNPHELIMMLFDGLIVAVGGARQSLARGDVAGKGAYIGRAVRILEEGLKAGLDMERGGELAVNLRGLYDYCVARLTEANLRNDDAALADVVRIIEPLVEGWRGIAGAAPTEAPARGA